MVEGADLQKASEKKPKQASTSGFDLKRASFREILDNYVFIADFNLKSPERPISKEVFWKYPFKLPPVKFDLDLSTNDLRKLVFQVRGSGRTTAMFNDGRAAFLANDFSKATAIWLEGRKLIADDAASTKIIDFFLGVNALASYQHKKNDKTLETTQQEFDGLFKQVAYFFASAFISRRDVQDERIDPYSAWALYNIAVVYHHFDRMPSVFGAASEGLSALLKSGKNINRSKLRQLLAEAHLKNQDLLSAIQELDTALRQDPDPSQASRIFNRAGDIYYDLNNYELAEDMYLMASAIDRERQVYSAAQAVLRGETAFWLGKFEESGNLFKYALDVALRSADDEWLRESQTLPWINLRIADAFLARALVAKSKIRDDLFAKANLAYFRTQTDYPKSEASKIAEIRRACLELPTYEGNNIKHAREVLVSAKQRPDVVEPLMELVWACHAKSFSDRDKSQTMVDTIKEFSEKYPQSKHLADMLEPVRDVQASRINEYFAKEQWESAIQFFEQRRSSLFPKVSDELARNLWIAYVSTSRSDSAREFWRPSLMKPVSDQDWLRIAAFLYEASVDKPFQSLVQDRLRYDSLLLKRTWGASPTERDVSYLGRVLVSNRVSSAYPWVLKIQDRWTKDDPVEGCSVLFPLLSRIQSDEKSAKVLAQDLAQRVGKFGKTHLEKLQDSDPSCFQSWLDLEARVLGPDRLAEQYKDRQGWKLAGPWLERTWIWSEDLYARGKKIEAREIWKRIVDTAPKDSFENKMAATRLDPNKTEYESLWQ
jgi:tetratricopeptide (TPR) repeat protein